MDRLLELADELYGLDLAEFTPGRDARAKELKASDPELSRAVKALRKPSVAAWVVNLLVRREAAQVEQVLSVGAALRAAQASLAGDELRALTRQRRQLTAAVTSTARAHAADRGLRVTSAVADQVEATLTAAMVDEGAASAVRSGLLVAALATTGLGDLSDLVDSVGVPEALGFTPTPISSEAVQPARPELHVVPDPDADAKALAGAQEKLDAAEAERAEAGSAVESAAGELAELEATSLQLQSEVEELRRRLAELEDRAEGVDEELSDAEDVRAEADDALREATRARDAARAVVDRLSR